MLIRKKRYDEPRRGATTEACEGIAPYTILVRDIIYGYQQFILSISTITNESQVTILVTYRFFYTTSPWVFSLGMSYPIYCIIYGCMIFRALYSHRTFN